MNTLLAITLLSLLPIQTLPKVEGSDKSHHLIAYFFLALPLGLKKKKKSFLILYGWSAKIRSTEELSKLERPSKMSPCNILVFLFLKVFIAYYLLISLIENKINC